MSRLEAADVLMPNLSALSESDLQDLKGGVVPSDAVCLPPAGKMADNTTWTPTL